MCCPCWSGLVLPPTGFVPDGSVGRHARMRADGSVGPFPRQARAASCCLLAACLPLPATLSRRRFLSSRGTACAKQFSFLPPSHPLSSLLLSLNRTSGP